MRFEEINTDDIRHLTDKELLEEIKNINFPDGIGFVSELWKRFDALCTLIEAIDVQSLYAKIDELESRLND